MNLRKKRRGSVEIEEVDITSLLDILCILLVFLLKSFSTSDLNIDLVNGLALPFSNSTGIAHQGVVIQVNENKELFINSKPFGTLNGGGLAQMSKYLGREFMILNKRLSDSGRKTTDNKLVNLVFDKTLKYVEINQVLAKASDAGFGKYKLIIQGDE
jgi:biopolymer transport protein ExbD